MEKRGDVVPIFSGADFGERQEYLGPKLPDTPPFSTPEDLPAPAQTEHLNISPEATGPFFREISSTSVESSFQAHPIVVPSSVAPFRKRVLPKFVARCRAAMANIENPRPEWFTCPWNYKSDYFDFHRFHLWFDANIPAWPKGTDPPSADEWVDVYSERENGPSIMAFICNEGVIVAADCSVIGGATSPSFDHKFIRFNSHVIGCIAGEAADCELFLSRLPPQDEGKSAEDVSDWLVETQYSRNLKGLSGIVIAGWDDKGPTLYRLDGEGKLHQGVVFACGSCSEYGYSTLGSKSFPLMSITQAAKLARIALPTAVADLKYFSGRDDFGGEAESDKIGDSVVVYCVGPRVIGMVDGTGAIKETWQG